MSDGTVRVADDGAGLRTLTLPCDELAQLRAALLGGA